jgi:hypothetical protein
MLKVYTVGLQIVLDYPEYCIPERYLDSFSRREQERMIFECKANMVLYGSTRAELKKFNFWNLSDAERVEVLRQKILRENNNHYINH